MNLVHLLVSHLTSLLGTDFEAVNENSLLGVPRPESIAQTVYFALQLWLQTGYFDALRQRIPGFNELALSLQHASPLRIVQVNDLLPILESYSNSSELTGLLNILRERQLLAVLWGQACTESSVMDQLPPTFEECMISASETSTKLEPPHVALSVAAIALSKHWHRSKSRWWLKDSKSTHQLTGSNTEKNEHAMKILQNLWKTCSWFNLYWMHTAPGRESQRVERVESQRRESQRVLIFEIRIREGYGARWQQYPDKWQFRGFIEPHVPNGHEQQWRH